MTEYRPLRKASTDLSESETRGDQSDVSDVYGQPILADGEYIIAPPLSQRLSSFALRHHY